MAWKYTISGRCRFYNARNTLFLAVAGLHGLEIHYFWPSQVLQCPKYTISGRRRFYNARNTLFLAVASFTAPEIQYFWLSQVLQRPKYSISGRRKFAWPRNTVFPSDGVVRRYSLFRVAPFGQVRLRPRVGVEQVFASHEAITIEVGLPGGADAVFGEAGGDLAA